MPDEAGPIDTRFRQVQDASPDSFILMEVVADAAGEMQDARIRYANPAACLLMGRELGSLDGRLLDEAFPGARDSGRYAMYAEVYRTGVRRELTFFHEQVGKWLRIVVVRVGDGFCIISSDVSALKAAELVLQRANVELERRVSDRTQELEAARDLAEAASRAKSDFLSRASHELRTPLNSVIGFSSVLIRNRGGRLSGADLDYARRINSNGLHLLALVNELLDLSRIEAGRMELQLSTVPLIELVRDVCAMLEPSAEQAGLSLTVEIDGPQDTPGEIHVVTDAQRLRQVLVNLAGNALKFTERGGVTLRVVVNDAGYPERLDISDTGPGIPMERIEAMFEPFVIGDAKASPGESTGLGLAISRSICNALGYLLTASSELGVGSTFSVHLAGTAIPAG